MTPPVPPRRTINICVKADRRAFSRWLVKMGAKRKSPAAWEIMRFSTSRGTLIVQQGRKGITLNPVASEMLDRYCAGINDLISPINAAKRGDPSLLKPAALLAWVRSQGRVTVADLVADAGVYFKDAYFCLAELENAGDLTVEGGSKREPIYWRAS